MGVFPLFESPRPFHDTPMIKEDAARSLARRDLEEESLEKVRDLLLEIKDCLKVQTLAGYSFDASIVSEVSPADCRLFCLWP